MPWEPIALPKLGRPSKDLKTLTASKSHADATKSTLFLAPLKGEKNVDSATEK